MTFTLLNKVIICKFRIGTIRRGNGPIPILCLPKLGGSLETLPYVGADVRACCPKTRSGDRPSPSHLPRPQRGATGKPRAKRCDALGSQAQYILSPARAKQSGQSPGVKRTGNGAASSPRHSRSKRGRKVVSIPSGRIPSRHDFLEMKFNGKGSHACHPCACSSEARR